MGQCIIHIVINTVLDILIVPHCNDSIIMIVIILSNNFSFFFLWLLEYSPSFGFTIFMKYFSAVTNYSNRCDQFSLQESVAIKSQCVSFEYD